MTEEKLIEVNCKQCRNFYTAREGSKADKSETCQDCLIKGEKTK